MLEIPKFYAAMPEMFVLAMISVTIVVGLFAGKHTKVVTYGLVQLTLIIATILSLRLLKEPSVVTFNQAFVLDHLASVLKIFVYIISFACFLYSRRYVAQRKILFFEYYVLGLFAVLGMMVLISANSFLTLYLGLELFSLPIYAMVAMWKTSNKASEAAIKYFVTGAMASGMLLYGLSIIYGASQSLVLPDVAQHIASTSSEQSLVYLFALVFVVAGIAFKLGAAPFHMWAPDVYHGAPTSVTLFIGSAPKLAAAALMLRLLTIAMPSLHVQWQELLMFVSILSMAIGNFVAIVQSNLKRMLAYSSIAQMGYVLLGVIAGTADGYAAATFYVITYTLMTLCAFAIMIALSKTGFEAEEISDFQGLNVRNPWLAFMMLIVMFSMAGIPPAVGFFAKLGVLQALSDVGLNWLVILSLILAVIGSYYYIRVVKVMYFEAPELDTKVSTSLDMRLLISINGVAVLLLGIFPSSLMQLCRTAF